MEDNNNNNIYNDIGFTPLRSINKINLIDNPQIVVGIDFGTSGVGYAYAFSNNITNIISSDFNGQSKDKKVPTEIILDTNLEDVLAFGEKCKDYIIAYDKNNYMYFKNIKMNLYRKIYKIKSTNGTEADIEFIITKILEEVSKNAVNQIQKKNNKKKVKI